MNLSDENIHIKEYIDDIYSGILSVGTRKTLFYLFDIYNEKDNVLKNDIYKYFNFKNQSDWNNTHYPERLEENGIVLNFKRPRTNGDFWILNKRILNWLNDYKIKPPFDKELREEIAVIKFLKDKMKIEEIYLFITTRKYFEFSKEKPDITMNINPYYHETWKKRCGCKIEGIINNIINSKNITNQDIIKFKLDINHLLIFWSKNILNSASEYKKMDLTAYCRNSFKFLKWNVKKLNDEIKIEFESDIPPKGIRS